MEEKLAIYTDGACSGNPGPGGWAAIYVLGGDVKEISGGEYNTTNNRMELMAAIESLKALNQSCSIILYSDSQYLVDCFNKKWYVSWRKNGWRNSKKEPVANKDLWEELISLADKHNIQFSKVKGHAGVEYNERCDALARARRDSFK